MSLAKTESKVSLFPKPGIFYALLPTLDIQKEMKNGAETKVYVVCISHVSWPIEISSK